MARTKVTMKSRGVVEILNSDGARDLVTERAERVLSAARSSAPVESGAYRDGLHIEQATTDRAVARVTGGTDHDWIVEANTGNLARAMDAR